jgi:hypothetical protein
VLFGNPWTWSAGVGEKIYPRLPSAGFADAQPNFVAVVEAQHPDIGRDFWNDERFAREKKDGQKVIACCVLFDARGKIAAKGALTHEETADWVEKLLRDAPGAPVDVGGGWSKHAALAKDVAAKKGFPRVEKLDDDEGRRLQAALKRWADGRRAGMRAALVDDPALAEMRLKELNADLKGTKLGEGLTIAPDEMKAARELRKIRDDLQAVASCANCKSKLQCAFVCTTCATCRAEQAAPLRKLRERLQALLASCEKLEIAGEVRALLEGWK